MLKNITVRAATENDLPVLLKFEQGVITAERPFDPTIQPGDINYYDLQTMITAPHIHLVVAEENKRILACGYARIEPSRHYLNHTSHTYLGFMYTDPEFRGKGVNQMVLDALKDWSMTQGIKEMILEVYCENTTAIKAYEKYGFTKHLYQMRLGI
jgi:ribosomal protein S18 acetylase RimI-like enzyme